MDCEPGRCALVFFPDLEDAQLDAFRRRHDPWSERVAEHVTLVHPAAGPFDRRAVVEHVLAVLARWAPFEIRMHGPEESWDHWLLLPVREGREQVCRLHEELCAGPLAGSRRADLEYRPALGLGFFGPEGYDPLDPAALAPDRDALDGALGEAVRLGFDYRCTLDSLTLIGLDAGLRRIEALQRLPLSRRALP